MADETTVNRPTVRVRWSAERNELFAATSQLQGALPVVVKDSEGKIELKSGGGYKYSYAALPDCWDALRPHLSPNGLALMQFVDSDGSVAIVTTVLGHSSGQWVESVCELTAGDMSPQKLGSAMTYAKRYALCAICGIAPSDDDDGAAATQGHAAPRKTAPVPAKMAPAPVQKPVSAVGPGRTEDMQREWPRMPESAGDLKGMSIDKLTAKQLVETWELYSGRLAQAEPDHPKYAAMLHFVQGARDLLELRTKKAYPQPVDKRQQITHHKLAGDDESMPEGLR